jgi:hypothetical protein
MASKVGSKVGDTVFLIAAIHAAVVTLTHLVPIVVGKPQAWNPFNRMLFTEEALLILDSPLPSLAVEIACFAIIGFGILFYHVYREGVAKNQHVVRAAIIYKILLALAVAQKYAAGNAGIQPMFAVEVGTDVALAAAFAARLAAVGNIKLD